MRKLLIGLPVVVLLLACLPMALLATGTISPGSLSMILNVITGQGGSPTTASEATQRFRLPPA